jgi:hypothetical protein
MAAGEKNFFFFPIIKYVFFYKRLSNVSNNPIACPAAD